MNRTLENSKLFSMTISPSYRLFDPLYLYNEDLPMIVRWCRKFSKHYIFFTEFDDVGRIHYHGTIQIDDQIKYYRTKPYIDRSFGFVKHKRLKTPLDLLKWTFYCRKQYHLTFKLFPFIMHHKKNKIKKLTFHGNPLTIMQCFEGAAEDQKVIFDKT